MRIRNPGRDSGAALLAFALEYSTLAAAIVETAVARWSIVVMADVVVLLFADFC
jgi:hypothetical protein